MFIRKTLISPIRLTGIFLILSVILGEFGRVEVIRHINIRLTDLAVLLFLVSGFPVESIIKSRLYFIFKLINIIFFTMLFTLCLRLTELPLAEILQASLYPIRWYIYSLIPFCFLNMPQDLALKLIKITIIGLLILALMGILQFIFIPNLGFLESLGYDPHVFRLVSTWLDPNFIGAAMVMGISGVMLVNRTLIKRATLYFIFFTALLLTFSRSSYLMFLVFISIFCMFIRKLKYVTIAALAIAILVIILIFPRAQVDMTYKIDREQSANLRLVSYMNAFKMFTDKPFLGVGYGLIRYEKTSRQFIYDLNQGGNSGSGFESSWATILAGTGLIGFISYLIYMIAYALFILEIPISKLTSLSSTLFNNFTKPRENTILLGLLLSWLIHGLFLNSLLFPNLMVIWGMLIGFLISKNYSTIKG